MAQMDSDEKDAFQDSRQGRPGFGLWSAGILLLLVFYILSPGPIVKLGRSPRSSFIRSWSQAIVLLYAPLNLLYDSSPPVKRFYDWYLHEVWKTY
jgi:hypothetical protein